MSAPALNHERQQVLDAFMAGHTSAQTIATHLSKSRTSVQNHLAGLVDENLLERPRKGEYQLPQQVQVTAEADLVHAADMTDLADMVGHLACDPGTPNHIA